VKQSTARIFSPSDYPSAETNKGRIARPAGAPRSSLPDCARKKMARGGRDENGNHGIESVAGAAVE
jgi:hypothetical protein